VTSDPADSGFITRLEAYCRSLCLADWQDPNGPLRLNRKLSLAELQSATFFLNTRQLFLALQEQGGTAATALIVQ
jgi:hypothetical protein